MMRYKIKLTPLDRFFFGGENVFGAEGGQKERRRSYLVHSNILPQQTSLLGMLREQLLTQNDLLLDAGSNGERRQKAADLVGETGFSARQDGPFGLIRALSPVLIEDGNQQLWQPAPLDDVEPLKTCHDATSGRLYLERFKAKEGLGLRFRRHDGKKDRHLPEFFRAFQQVGITMTNRTQHEKLPTKDPDEAYYRQTFLGNAASSFAQALDETPEAPSLHAFVFWADLDPAIANFHFADALTQLGGERSGFRMELTPLAAEGPLDAFLSPVKYRYNRPGEPFTQRYKRIVLLSDAYADWDLVRKHAALAVAQTTPFRYFSTNLLRTQHFYDFKEKNDRGKTQSQQHTLLQRGSVLYADGDANAKALTDHLDAQKAFHRIGYNYYQTI